MKTKNLLFAVLLMAASITLTSCDEDLAERLAGTWEFTHVSQEDDGTEIREVQTLTFRYISPTDGGTIVERIDGKLENLALGDEEDDLNGSYFNMNYHTTIQGTYVIRDGDLHIKYDLKSLKVTVEPKDIELVIKDDELRKGMKETGQTEDDFKKEMLKDGTKDLLKDLRSEYAEDNKQDRAYLNVEIEGSDMYCNTVDLGRINFKRK